MRKIDPSRRSVKFVEKLPAKHQRQIAEKITALRAEPMPQNHKFLKGKWEGYLRADSGEYRIIYQFDDETLFIENIGKRNDDEVYR